MTLLALFQTKRLCISGPVCTVADQGGCVSRVLCVLFQTKRAVYHVHSVYCCRPRGLCISCPLCTVSDQEGCVSRALCVLLQTERGGPGSVRAVDGGGLDVYGL